MTRWLTEEELGSWFPLAGVMLKLNTALDSQLQRDSDMTHFDYLCLAMLSEEDDFTSSMSALAARTNASLSRLSHVISKLERRGRGGRRPAMGRPPRSLGPEREQRSAGSGTAPPGPRDTVRGLDHE